MKPREPGANPRPPVAKPRKDQEQLDEALQETFPSSDPVSVSVSPKEQEWTPEELAEAERKRRSQPRDRG
jgi:hypothetical protein